MPEMKLGANSSAWSAILRAFEERAALPLGQGGDRSWLNQVLEVVNKNEGTDIAYTGRENYGYYFTYATPKSALLLSEIKSKARL